MIVRHEFHSVQPFIILSKQQPSCDISEQSGCKAALLLAETNISHAGTISDTTNRTRSPVAIRLQDQSQVLMRKSHVSDAEVTRAEGAAAYVVYRESSFPEVPKTTAAQQLAWTFDEVYQLCCSHYLIMHSFSCLTCVFRCDRSSPCTTRALWELPPSRLGVARG